MNVCLVHNGLPDTGAERSVKGVLSPPSLSLSLIPVLFLPGVKETMTNRLSHFSLQPPTPQLPLKHVDTPVSSTSSLFPLETCFKRCSFISALIVTQQRAGITILIRCRCGQMYVDAVSHVHFSPRAVVNVSASR